MRVPPFVMGGTMKTMTIDELCDFIEKDLGMSDIFPSHMRTVEEAEDGNDTIEDVRDVVPIQGKVQFGMANGVRYPEEGGWEPKGCKCTTKVYESPTWADIWCIADAMFPISSYDHHALEELKVIPAGVFDEEEGVRTVMFELGS